MRRRGAAFDMTDALLRDLARGTDGPLLVPPAVLPRWEPEQAGGEPAPPPPRTVTARPTSGEQARAAADRERREEEEARRTALVGDVAQTIREGGRTTKRG